jgi:sialic acid synthase SpsE
MKVEGTYIIGEIGQNHNGSVDLAKLLADLVTRKIEDKLFGYNLKGMDAVKLTKRDLKHELSQSQMNRPYNNPHSFGRTYGEHREFLELSDEEHHMVFKHAKSIGLDFVETLCSEKCLSLLKYFSPDFLKVASRDLTNLPLLNALAETKIPIILSTGMAGQRELEEGLEVVSRYHDNISILHCVSEYPTNPKNVNLNTIRYLQKHFGKYRIGFSDHTIGITAAISAVAMGAQIVEKHITIDRRMKGTDQEGSLGPDGMMRMVRDIRLLEMSMGVEDIFIENSTQTARLKLERSVASKRAIAMGEVITEDDIHLLSPGDGFKWRDRDQVVGKAASSDIPADEIIYPNMIN